MSANSLVKILSAVVILSVIAACNSSKPETDNAASGQLPLDSIKAIATEAYIYAYPMVDAYRIEYAYFVEEQNPEYKAPWNQLKNIANVYTPADKVVQTPNSDTPYSMAGLDLRTEPMILIVPEIEANRYFSFQLIDAYTANFDYIGSRTTGNGGGVFMLAGPNWKGETPDGVTKVFQTETELMLVIGRTQLFDPTDIRMVKNIQAGYQLLPLSAFLGTAAPEQAPVTNFVKPLTPKSQKTSVEVFNILNFLLQFCPTDPSEKELMARFAKIGIGAGKTIDTTQISADVLAAMKQGIQEAWTNDFAAFKAKIDAGEVTSGDLFGNRADLKNNYLYRMGAAVLGIFGNTAEEAMYPIYSQDADGNKLDGTVNKYTLHVGEDQLPPVNAFWSLTMY